MTGWFIPPPSRPVKSDEDLRLERETKVAELGRSGLLRSERLRRAMLRVRREDFIPAPYRDHAYHEVPLPLPGERATISCPHSYPLFYEPLGLDEGHRFLELGVGSGYGTPRRGRHAGRGAPATGAGSLEPPCRSHAPAWQYDAIAGQPERSVTKSCPSPTVTVGYASADRLGLCCRALMPQPGTPHGRARPRTPDGNGGC